MKERSVGILALLVLLSACATAVPTKTTTVETPFDEIESLAVPTAVQADATPAPISDQPTINNRIVTDEEYSFPSLIPFDGIRPIYDPQFVSAQDAPYQDDELVMGVAWGGEAKAYAITVLRHREMVNDELAGIPTLVTW
jgi:hypothetical protein